MGETQKHICGRCHEEFESEQDYLDHECEKTGFAPTDAKHQGKAFEAVSKAALERGAKRKAAEAGPKKAAKDDVVEL